MAVEAGIIGVNEDGTYRVGQPLEMVEPGIWDGKPLDVAKVFADDTFDRAIIVTDEGPLVIQRSGDDLVLVDLHASESAKQVQGLRIDPNVGTMSDFLVYGTADGAMHRSGWVEHAVFEEARRYEEDFAMENFDPVSQEILDADSRFTALIADKELIISDGIGTSTKTYEIAGAKRLISGSRIALVVDKAEATDLSSAFEADFASAYVSTEGGQTYRLSPTDTESVFSMTDRKGVSGEVFVETPLTVGMTFEEGNGLDFPIARVALEYREQIDRDAAQEVTQNYHDFAIESFDRSVRNVADRATPDTSRGL